MEGAQTDDDRLHKIFDYCRRQVKNIADEGAELTASERSNRKENKTPSDTLKRGLGSSAEINQLFAAMAMAAGFEVRLVRVGDRDDVEFSRDFADMYFLRSYDIAVKVADQWKFLDAGSTYVPYGMLVWQEEGVAALITDPKEPTLVITPVSAPERSMERRRATLKIAEDGTAEGDVTVEYSGHAASGRKSRHSGDSAEKLEDQVKEAVKASMSTAEVTNIKVENANDPEKPLRESFHVKVPGYAQRTGKRLFISPAFFQFNDPPMFAASQRKYAVVFRHAWAEDDDVIIEMPPSYELDNAEQPASFGLDKIGKYAVTLQLTPDRRSLHYQRQFVFGNGGALVFPEQSYAALKGAFDKIHKEDGHVVTLKQAAQ
jgi:Transglutaminase-like superfamily